MHGILFTLSLCWQDKELIGAEARSTELQQEVARLRGDKAVLQCLLKQKSASLPGDSGASEALHTAQDSSKASGAADQIRGLQEEVARLQHDKSLMQNRLTDMGIELEAAEARADRLTAVQENARLPCFPVHLLSGFTEHCMQCIQAWLGT